MTCPKCGSDNIPGTEPSIRFECGATSTWQPEACRTIAKLRAALKDLADAAEPMAKDKPMTIGDYFELNEARYRALMVLEVAP